MDVRASGWSTAPSTVRRDHAVNEPSVRWALALSTARSAAVTAASMPGLWLALMTAEEGVSRSTLGAFEPGVGIIIDGLYIFTSPWLLPHSSAPTMMSACSAASVSPQPILRSAAAVCARASSIGTSIVDCAALLRGRADAAARDSKPTAERLQNIAGRRKSRN